MQVLDYSPRDFDTHYARLKALAGKWFVDADGNSLWTDFDKPTAENTLLKSIAWEASLLGVMRDQHFAEVFPATVKRRENFIKFASPFGYQLRSPVPASADVTFTIAAPIADDVVIAAGTLLQYGNASHYTPVAYMLLAGQTEVDGSARQVAKRAEVFASTDQASQKHLTANVNYVDGSMEVETASGDWTEVSTFIDSVETSRHFKIEKDSRYRARIVFGDGANGALPEGNVTANYETTLGRDGLVSAGRLSGSLNLLDEGGNPVVVSYVNPEASAGADDGQSTGEAKALFPDFVRTPEGIVTDEDYEALMVANGSVAAACMLTRHVYAGVGVNEGKLYVVAKGDAYATVDEDGDAVEYTLPGTASAALLAELQVAVEAKRMTSFRVTVYAAIERDIDIQAKVYMSADHDEDEVSDAIHDALVKWFAVRKPDGSLGDVEFGKKYPRVAGTTGQAYFRWSDIFNLIRDVGGVEHVPPDQGNLVLNGLHEDAKIYLWEFPVLGDVRVINMATGSVWDY